MTASIATNQTILVVGGGISGMTAALEMAEAGHSTAALPTDAAEAAVRAALSWDERLWPWQPYAGAVMAAVRAGVPVLG